MKAPVRSYSLRASLKRQRHPNETTAAAVGRREQLVGARNDGAHRTFGEFRWIFASSRVGPQNKKRTDVRDMRGFS